MSYSIPETSRDMLGNMGVSYNRVGTLTKPALSVSYVEDLYSMSARIWIRIVLFCYLPATSWYVKRELQALIDNEILV